VVGKEDVDKIVKVFKENSTINFADYSEKSFIRRLEKILIDENCTIDDIVSKIETDNIYLNLIKNTITVNTTELFRDSEMWLNLKIPFKNYIKHKSELQIWHAGVSTGEELYSMKMFLQMIGYSENLTLIGTDLNDKVIELAKAGVYKNNIIADYIQNFDLVNNTFNYLDAIKLTDFANFNKATNKIEIKPSFKKDTDFFVLDLLNAEYNFQENFDIIMCRNVLIYFNLELQNKILNKFHNLLKPKGLLILGTHESIMPPIANKFKKTDGFYEKK